MNVTMIIMTVAYTIHTILCGDLLCVRCAICCGSLTLFLTLPDTNTGQHVHVPTVPSDRAAKQTNTCVCVCVFHTCIMYAHRRRFAHVYTLCMCAHITNRRGKQSGSLDDVGFQYAFMMCELVDVLLRGSAAHGSVRPCAFVYCFMMSYWLFNKLSSIIEWSRVGRSIYVVGCISE